MFSFWKCFYIISVSYWKCFVFQIPADLPVSHSCVYIFTCSGFYKFEIYLKVKGHHHGDSDLDQRHSVAKRPVAIAPSIATSSRGLTQTEMTSEKKGQGSRSEVKSQVMSSSQVLKCSSVIEINIID